MCRLLCLLVGSWGLVTMALPRFIQAADQAPQTEQIEGTYTLSTISTLPGKNPQLHFTPKEGSDKTKLILPLTTVNNALQEGQSYRIVATVIRKSSQAAEAQQMLIYLPAAHGLTIPLWLNSPHNAGQPYGEIGYLKMDLPFGGTITYL